MSTTKKNKLTIADPTLRDGSHANQHRFTANDIAVYCRAVSKAGVPIVEVGHGNGLGASSLQVGLALTPDSEMIETARNSLTGNTKLGVFMIPGFATIKKDLAPAIEAGVDVVRVGAHCTEADITERHISYTREKGKIIHACLMSSHMASPATLLEECRKLETYGAQGVILMDSAGYFTPVEVRETIHMLVSELSIPIGFHGHNNLSLAVANSLMAVEAGASIIDGTAKGFGAGSGNTPIEVLVAVLNRLGYETGIDLYSILDSSDIAEKQFIKVKPETDSISIVSGLAGVFSGFKKPAIRIAEEYKVDPREIFVELGKRRVVGGQEDMIVEVAIELAKKANHQ
jgi:4-hydroxy 2-oxovalerate aldolase